MANIYYPFPLTCVSEWAGTDRGGGVKHFGTDFAVDQGTPVPATIGGTVVWTGDDGLGAWCIDIERDDGLIVRLGHLSRIDVAVGQRVNAAQIVGLSGGTPGTPGAGASTGPHLHWEVRWDRAWSWGRWVDPRTLKPAQSTALSGMKPKKEDAVKAFHYEHREVRPIAPKQRLYLCDARGKKQDLVGEAGPCVLTAHVYGERFAEGDVIEIRYEFVKAGKSSPHYLERVIADKYGIIQASRTFQRSVGADVVVNLSVYASQGNKGGLARITLLDSDASTFVAA